MITLRARVTKLEWEMKEMQTHGGETRVLASGAHEDTGTIGAKLNAQTSLLQALRTTQVEQGKQIVSLRTEVATLDTKVGRLDTKVGQLDTKVDQLDTKVGQLDTKVGEIDTKVEGLRTEMRAGFAHMAGLLTAKKESAN